MLIMFSYVSVFRGQQKKNKQKKQTKKKQTKNPERFGLMYFDLCSKYGRPLISNFGDTFV